MSAEPINAHVVLDEHGRSAGSMRGSPSSRSAVQQVPVDRHISGGTHAPRVTGIPVANRTRLFFAAAARPDDLLARLGDTDTVVAGSSLLAVPETAPLRIAIVDPTPERVELARQVVARGTPWRGPDDVWFSPAGLLVDGRAKVAFTFPGVEPGRVPELADVAAHFGIVQPAGPDIIRVGRLLVEALQRLGVEPDVIAGHGLGEVVGGLPLGAPRIPTWSSITVQAFATDREEICELVGNLYDDGVRVFVEPGPGGVTGFVGDTLGDRDHLAIAAAQPQRSGLGQLTRVAAALWVDGADIRFERLAAPALKFMQDALPDPTEVSSTHPVPQASVRAGASAPETTWQPLTTIGLLVEAARRLAPDRVVVGLQDVRARRGLAVEPPAEVSISARYTGPDRIDVSIDSDARAVVRLGDAYPQPPQPDTAPLADERPAPHTAEALYEERLVFPSPQDEGVVDVRALGTDGVRGTIVALPAPGSLLDAAGQLVGYWAMVGTTAGKLALPNRIGRIDFYGPPPPVGTRFEVSVRLREVTPSEAVADIEIVRDGAIWARMLWFSARRVDASDELMRVLLFPEVNGLAEPALGGAEGWVVRKPWTSVATRELVMRRYLGESERAEYAALTALAQGHWLLGRIAVKDAVRAWLWDRGAGPIDPTEVHVRTDGRGDLVVAGPGGSPPAVSLSLLDGEAVVRIRPAPVP